MDMVRSPAVNSTYNGLLDFLDNQASFDNIFGTTPEMLRISARSSRAVEESDTLRSKIDKFVVSLNCTFSAILCNYNMLAPIPMILTR